MPKRRTRRPSRTIPTQRRPARPTRPTAAPAAGPAQPSSKVPGLDPTDPIWRAYAPLAAALEDPAFGAWLDTTQVVRAVDVVLATMGPDGRFNLSEVPDDLSEIFGVTGAADEVERDRAWLIVNACVQCSVFETHDRSVRPGPTSAFWSSPDTAPRTLLRGMVAVAAMEASIRVLPGRGYRGEQVSVMLAAAVGAAASSDPWRLDDVSRRCGGPFAFVVADEVRRRLAELQALGLLSSGEVLVAPPGGRGVVETVALALAETPVPAPRHPDTRVKGPTYEVEATVDVGGELRTRVVLVGGGSRVSLLTDVLMTAFGLRDDSRTTSVMGLQLTPSSGTPGLLTRAGADRDDPWTIEVGDSEEGDEYGDRSGAVVSAGVTVRSLVEHLGERWELPVDLSGVDLSGVDDNGDDGDDDGDDDGGVLLQLRVRRTHAAEDSRDLVFPACVAGSGPHLAAVRDEATGVARAELDLVALDAVVARVHRGVHLTVVTGSPR